MKGDFGFWQSALKYPDNPCVWGQRTDPEGDHYDPFVLSCEFIRYHRFPDNCTTHIHDNLGCEDAEHVNVLGVEFSNIQPFLDLEGNEIKDIVGYEINVYDRRNNKSVLHKGMIYNMWEESLPDCTTSYFANFPFNDLNENIYLSRTRARYKGPFNFGERDYTPFNAYARDRFQYISPDVSYERNDTGEFLRLFSEENGFIEGKFAPTDDLFISSRTTFSIFRSIRKPSGIQLYNPLPRRLIKPARSINLWLISSASVGASLRVEIQKLRDAHKLFHYDYNTQ